MDNRPIGIFDSGVGGLTVVKSLLETLADENFIYLGDTAHVPYGNKTKTQLMSYAHSIISYFLSQQVKAVVVACGTHSSVTLPDIKDQYEVPILGVVKAGARSAAQITTNGRIGVAATQATVNSQSFTREIAAISPDFAVYEMACPRFVPLVESGNLASAETFEAIDEYIGPLIEEKVDTIVLGCTHYPFLASAIKKYVGEAVKLVDPSCETVTELKSLLATQNLLSSPKDNPYRRFYVSGNDESFYKVGTLLIGNVINQVQRVPLD